MMTIRCIAICDA